MASRRVSDARGWRPVPGRGPWGSASSHFKTISPITSTSHPSASFPKPTLAQGVDAWLLPVQLQGYLVLYSCTWLHGHVHECDSVNSPREEYLRQTEAPDGVLDISRSQTSAVALSSTPSVDFSHSLLKCDTWLEAGLDSPCTVASREGALKSEREQRGKVLPCNIFKSTPIIRFPPPNGQRRKKEMEIEDCSPPNWKATVESQAFQGRLSSPLQ